MVPISGGGGLPDLGATQLLSLVFGFGSPSAFAAVFAALLEHTRGRCLHTPGLFPAQRPAPEVRWLLADLELNRRGSEGELWSIPT